MPAPAAGPGGKRPNAEFTCDPGVGELSVGTRIPALARSSMDYVVAFDNVARGNLRQLAQLLVIGREVRPRGLKQFLEIVDDEIALLEGVEPIAGMHDAQQIE